MPQSIPGNKQQKRAWNVIWNDDPDQQLFPSIQPNDDSGQPLDESSPTIMKIANESDQDSPQAHTKSLQDGKKPLPQLALILTLFLSHSSVIHLVTSDGPVTTNFRHIFAPNILLEFPKNSIITKAATCIRRSSTYNNVALVKNAMPLPLLSVTVSKSLFSWPPPYREESLASTNLVECCGGEHLISYNEGHSDVQ